MQIVVADRVPIRNVTGSHNSEQPVGSHENIIGELHDVQDQP
jgi:hypothetical protein